MMICPVCTTVRGPDRTVTGVPFDRDTTSDKALWQEERALWVRRSEMTVEAFERLWAEQAIAEVPAEVPNRPRRRPWPRSAGSGISS
jgi:hypothetical protein